MEKPKIEVIRFNTTDIVTASSNYIMLPSDVSLSGENYGALGSEIMQVKDTGITPADIYVLRIIRETDVSFYGPVHPNQYGSYKYAWFNNSDKSWYTENKNVDYYAANGWKIDNTN